ncbi:MAG: aminotransferase class IV [Desulfovibrio sp.]|nr:aminotransferase class IV [Desulfovibrio sp.]MBI4960702.1 aminotransferase class IV [Desulfovibrio sp.]
MIAWLDGHLVEDAAPLHLVGPAFRCGMGVFETVLHHVHQLPRFERHVERLVSSLDALGIPHDIPGGSQLRRVVLDVALANGLAGETARVNLFGFQDLPGAKASLCVTVMAHAIDLDGVRKLSVYPNVHESYLCGHKTMANLHQRLAWEHAQREGMDDAVLLGKGGLVLEAASAALLFSDEHGFYVSRTPFRLPSLTLEAARGLLPIDEVEVNLGSIQEFKHVYWLNSLGGIQPVIQIDAVRYEPDWKTCRPLLRHLLGLDE